MADDITLLTKSPEEVPDAALAPFVQAARHIGDRRDGLPERIRRAHRLLFLFGDSSLIGVAAVKKPAMSYRRWVFESAGVPGRMGEFPLEFGWLFVLPGARGGSHVHRLIDGGRVAAGDKGLFSTLRSDAHGLLRISRRHGSVDLGTPYRSRDGEHMLTLIGAPPLER